MHYSNETLANVANYYNTNKQQEALKTINITIMQNGIQVFSNHLFGEVRVANENGKGFFAGSDVARALGYARPADAITAHCKGVVVLPTHTKNQHGTINQPTQRSMNAGLFEIKKTTITKPNGTTLVTTTPKVTGKGQIYFANKLLVENANNKVKQNQ